MFFKNFFRYFYFFLIIVLFIIFIFLTIKQYLIWKNDVIGRFLLPPYNNIFYLLNYVLIRYQTYLISLSLSLIFLGLTIFLNLKFQEKFFYSNEPYLAASFILILNWPYCFYYLILVLFFGVLFNLIFFFQKKHQERVSLYYFWLIFGILIFIFKNVLFII